MAELWLLDITEAEDERSVTLWLKDAAGRVRPRPVPWRPPFLVGGAPELLAPLSRRLADDPDVAEVGWTRARLGPEAPRPRRVLSVTARRNRRRRLLASRIDATGEYHRLTLFDVDLTPAVRYHLAHRLYPFAPVRAEGDRLVAMEPPTVLEYEAPPLTIVPFAIELAGHDRRRPPPVQGRIARVRIGPTVLDGPEEPLLLAVVDQLDRLGADVLLTDGGDRFDVPWLYRRARELGLGADRFRLGRAPVRLAPQRPARSFVTYGQVRRQEATYPAPGRFHIDRANSFVYGDADIPGLVDAARLSRLSLESLARQSPGTCFTAMEMATAYADGIAIPWKKNRPESFKSARTLVEADRGGVIFQPPVGVHSAVDEFDFTSLFPHLMVRHNLSVETLECRCCPDSPDRAPALGYRSCTRHVGLIPRTLAPLLARRLAYKAALRRPGIRSAEAEGLSRRVRMLKWILVTAFGYQGYRNARFGRIECHEAINAHARALLERFVHRAGQEGWETLHGLVDSLWLRPRSTAAAADPVAFAERMSAEFDLPLSYEGRYRWIVFLPAVTHGFGVPNRYYGLYETGEFKLRGIGLRRHDTPMVLRRFEEEILSALARAGNAEEVRRLRPRLEARIDLFAREIAAGNWPREELLVRHRLTRDGAAYSVFTDRVAAARQLARAGVAREAGTTVRYLIADRASRSWRHRVRVAELLEGDERYDVAAYLELLARSAETLLYPLGVRREELCQRWGLRPARRVSPHAAVALGQERLGEGPWGDSVKGGIGVGPV